MTKRSNWMVSGCPAELRGRWVWGFFAFIGAILFLWLSVAAADHPTPAWAEPYPLLDTVQQTEGSFVSTSAALNNRFLFFIHGPSLPGGDSMELWATDGSTPSTQRIARRVGWNPGALVSLGGSALFAAEEPATGRELWATSGQNGDPHVLLDIDPGAGSSNPDLLTRMGGHVYFRASDPTGGQALWRSDGTPAGTVKIRSFGNENSYSAIREIAGAHDRLYLLAEDENGATVFWVSDGTDQGTVALHTFNANANFPVPPLLMTAGNSGFARSSQEIWGSDGTAGGTFKLPDSLLDLQEFRWMGGESTLYMIANSWFNADKGEVWRSDGTMAGTVKVVDIGGGRVGDELVTIGDKLIFSFMADPDVEPYNMELWTSDGTAAGTKMVKDIVPGPNGSNPYSLVVVGDQVYFSIRGEEELWRSDGTTAGTQQVVMNTNDPQRPFFWPRNSFKDRLFVMVSDGQHGTEPWLSDGTTAGSFLLKDINAFNSDPSAPTNLTFYRNRLYFTALGGLWTSRGGLNDAVQLVPAQGTDWYVQQFGPGLAGSNGLVYFVAENHATQGLELWRTDGTAAGTIKLKQVSQTSFGEAIKEMVDLNGVLYFLVSEGPTANELWRSTGTPSGTVPLDDLFAPTVRLADVRELTASGSLLYFVANWAIGSEIWRTDGTRAGTLVADINPGPAGSTPSDLINAGEVLYFAADDGRRGRELWRTDGKPGGTYLIKDIAPGTGVSSSPTNLVIMRDTLYFLADDGVHGVELWRSDGTPAGTRLVKDAIPGKAHPPALELVAGRDRVFFRTAANAHGDQLWISDGAASGTQPIEIPLNDWDYDHPTGLTAVDNTLFFTVYPAQDKLYRSDGTAAGTFALDTPFPFFRHHSPYFLTPAPGRLFFSVDSDYGREPFVALTSLVTLTPDALLLPEGSGAKAVTVTLNRQPSAAVTITMSGSEPMQFTPSTLKFTPADWHTPQTVSIRAPGDQISQGTRPATVMLAIASQDTLFIDDTHTLPVLIQELRYWYSPVVIR